MRDEWLEDIGLSEEDRKFIQWTRERYARQDAVDVIEWLREFAEQQQAEREAARKAEDSDER